MHVITFDFHNTIAHCDAWFRLEVQDLPATVLREHDYPAATTDAATILFRRLRQEIVDSGKERTAVQCCQDVFSQLEIQIDPDRLTREVDALMHASMHDLSPVDGAIDTVRELHDSGYRMGVVSSAIHHQFVVWALESFGLVDAFDVIVTSASCGTYKSDPAIYRHALDVLGGAADQSIHVGDSRQWDVGTASQLGMGTVLLRTGKMERFRSDAASVEPDLELDTLVGASSHLDALSRGLRA